MNYKVNKILIIPAKFETFDGDNHCIINCLVGEKENGEDVVEKRRFENFVVENIDNPTYLFISIMFGDHFKQVIFTDAKEFENLFIENWGSLVLTAD